MSKICFIGGGSAKFIREIAVDLFSFPELQDVQITLMDVDKGRGERSERLVRKMIADLKILATVESTTNQKKALEGADYVFITIMVGGLSHYHSDVAIPAKYGVFQTVSDTIGPGGVFRTVRTAPVLQQIVNDLKQVSPDAWVLNYANPMAMNIWTLTACGHSRTVGLCHSIQSCYRQLAEWVGVPADEVKYTAAGINHVDFYLTLTHKDRDLYPDLIAKADEIVEAHPVEHVRFELLKYLGYFPAEGPWHPSEYFPWFRKNEAMIEHYASETYWGYNVDSAGFYQRIPEIEEQIAGNKPINYQRSMEYGARIVHSMETGQPRSFYGNVPNHGLIENLPPEAMVEVPCLVDENGIHPCRAGRIPPQLAAVMTPHIAVHEMAVTGTLQKNRRLIHQAIQADPLTGAILTLPQIHNMVEELFLENAEYTRDWA